jgi:arylsulfatase A
MIELLFTLFITLFACSSPPGPKPPNVILILADDLGYNDLSCYRERHEPFPDRVPTAQTPHIDRLAREGMLFTDFYAGAAVCSPSRAALLTGRNCTRVGIYNWIPERQPMHLRAGELTLGELLGKAGYQTAHFGKWHLTSQGMGQPLPGDQGYGYSFFTYNNADPSHRNPVNFFRDTVPVGNLEGYSCQLVMDEALAWLRELKPNGQPFYINVWFNEPHSKVAAPEQLASRHPVDPEYYGCIENMDLAVGRLLEYLEKEELEDHTLVIYTSDNGSAVLASNDPLRGRKAFNYEGGIRVPFLVRWPGNIPAGKVSEVPGSFPDVLPTLASVCGAGLPEDRILDGQDLSEVLLGLSQEMEREKPIFFFRYFHDPVCMLREGRWVLLGYQDSIPPYVRAYDQRALANLKPDPGEPRWAQWGFQESHMEYLQTAVPQKFELYDLEADISQRNDLSELHPERVRSMKDRMLSLRTEMIREGGNWYLESE